MVVFTTAMIVALSIAAAKAAQDKKQAENQAKTKAQGAELDRLGQKGSLFGGTQKEKNIIAPIGAPAPGTNVRDFGTTGDDLLTSIQGFFEEAPVEDRQDRNRETAKIEKQDAKTKTKEDKKRPASAKETARDTEVEDSTALFRKLLEDQLRLDQKAG